jgi:hypothetical protein
MLASIINAELRTLTSLSASSSTLFSKCASISIEDVQLVHTFLNPLPINFLLLSFLLLPLASSHLATFRLT